MRWPVLFASAHRQLLLPPETRGTRLFAGVALQHFRIRLVRCIVTQTAYFGLFYTHLFRISDASETSVSFSASFGGVIVITIVFQIPADVLPGCVASRRTGTVPRILVQPFPRFFQILKQLDGTKSLNAASGSLRISFSSIGVGYNR